MENLDQYRNLFCFLATMRDEAVDIYWGGYPELTQEEADALNSDECMAAFLKACADMAWESINQDWLLELPAKLAEHYGQRLKAAYVQKLFSPLLGPADT